MGWYENGGFNQEVQLLSMEEFLHHLGCLNPCEYLYKLPTSTGLPEEQYENTNVCFLQRCFTNSDLRSPMIDHEVNPAYQQAQQMNREP